MRSMSEISNVLNKGFLEYPEVNSQLVEHKFVLRNLVNSTHQYIYKELDHSHYDDLLDTIIENRRAAARLFHLSDAELCIMNQKHTNKVMVVDNNWPIGSEPVADSMVTNKPNLILAVQTADCVPILFADSQNKVIGAVHAGWRGARAGILSSTMNHLIKLGAKTESLIAAIGPCIRQTSYEVGQEFYDNFMKEGSENSQFFKPSNQDLKFFFDLPGYVYSKLIKYNIKVIDYNINTYTDSDLFFSYRRFTTQGEGFEGSLLSMICLRESK